MGVSRGFIALFSALVISGILFLFSTTADLAAYFAHVAVTEEHSYREAQEAAFTCARFAISRIEVDSERFSKIATTSITLSDDGVRCEIGSVEIQQNAINVIVRGMSGESSVPIQFTAARASSSADFLLQTWTEY